MTLLEEELREKLQSEMPLSEVRKWYLNKLAERGKTHKTHWDDLSTYEQAFMENMFSAYNECFKIQEQRKKQKKH